MCQHKGQAYRISFQHGSLMGGRTFGGVYLTNDVNEQKAIESHRDFLEGKIKIHFQDPEPIEEPKKEEQKPAEIFKGIKNGQSALIKLKELGYTEEETGYTPAEIAAFSKSKGFYFPDWLTFTK